MQGKGSGNCTQMSGGGEADDHRKYKKLPRDLKGFSGATGICRESEGCFRK